MQLLNHLKKRRANGRGWDERCGWKESMRTGITLLAVSVVFSLSGCGGGSSGSVGVNNLNVISGIVADGYINGATVCLDMNKNTVCDPTEPSTQTVAGGAFSLPLANPNDINLYPLVAEVPPTAIDEDTGLPVKNGYVLSAISGSKTPFISPISTLIQSKVAQGVTPAQAVIDVKTGLGFPANSTVDITSNFINSTVLSTVNKQKLRISAQVVARILAANNDVLKATLKKAGINKPSQVNALVYKKAFDQLAPVNQYVSTVSTLIGPVKTANIPSTIDLYLKSSNLSTGLGLTPTQQNQLDTTLIGQGSVGLSPAPASVTSPDASCVTPPNSLGGLSYAVSLGAGQKISYCFEVKEAKQDVIIKTTNTLNKVRFTLGKKYITTKGKIKFSAVTPWIQGNYKRYSDVAPITKNPLTKGIYKITFSEDVSLFRFSKGTKAKVNVYSDSISRLVKQGSWIAHFVTHDKVAITPYPLTIGTQQIKGSLNLVQNGKPKWFLGTTQFIRDIIPLKLNTLTTMANVSFKITGTQIFDVSLMNSAYAGSILNSDSIVPTDWEVWKGTSAQIKNKTFKFIKNNDISNAYYLVLTRKSQVPLLQSKNANDDVPYTVTVTTSSLPAVLFTTGGKTYQVSNYDALGINVVQSGRIKTATGTPVNLLTEFLTTPNNAKNLTSAMETFKSVMEFDENANMRFFADYTEIIGGLNYAQAGTSAYDFLLTAAIQYYSGQKGQIVISAVDSAIKITGKLLIDNALKNEGGKYIAFANAIFRDYSKKKQVFINQVYSPSGSISADLVGVNPLLQSKLMELFTLQSRGIRFMDMGMSIYKASADMTATPLNFMENRLLTVGSALVGKYVDKKKYGAVIVGAATTAGNIATISGNSQFLVAAFKTGLNVAKARQTSTTALLNDSLYHSYYDTQRQNYNLSILKGRGYVFDTIRPVITLTGAKNIVIAQGATYNDAGATATDTIDGNLTGKIKRVNNVNTFIPGVYQVTYNVNDSAANAAIQVVRSVTVTATPLFTPPKNITVTAAQGATSVAATNAKIAAFLKGATPSNRVVGLITNNAPVSFPVAKPTTVTFMAKDTAGIIATATATVTVKAASPVTVTVTAPVSITVTAAQGATTVPKSNAKITAFLKAASAANNVSSLAVTNNAPANFPVGKPTTVIFTAKDAGGNTGTATATVTVKKAIAIKDTIPPAVTPPNPLLMTFSFAVTSIPKANSKITAFLAAATATDKVGVVGGVTNNAPANFPVGTTTVIFTAKDAAGNIGTATATVTIKAVAPTAALVDGFDYPLGNRGVNANGLPLPFLEQITPEINSNYTNKTVTVKDYARFAMTANAAKWRNAQDVGSFNSAQGGVHPGEDWNLGAGDNDKGQPVYAVANGTVIAVRSTYRSGHLLGGWTIVLEHALSNGSKLYSFYAHITDSKAIQGALTASVAQFSLKVGDIVTRGQMIARLAAGSKTVGGMINFTSHLHLEMRTIKPMLTVGGGLWEGDNGLGYYTHLTPTAPRRANLIRRPVSMTAVQINAAYARMQTSLGIIDPSDYIDAHRAGLVGKVTFISPQTVVSGAPTLFTITGTSLPSTLAASLQGSLKGSCGAVTVNTAGTSATVTCTPGALNTGASFYIKNVTGGLILPGSVAFTVTVNATAPVKDTTPPVITLTGAATVSVSQGQNYVDLGATAFDVVDGYVTALKTSTVNTSAIGTYAVTYNVSDFSGNAAIPVVRTVNVVAATNPVVTTLNNGLVAYYPFDGYANDASGNGNNGTVFGGVTYTAGVIGQAVTFDGISGYIRINHSPSLNVTGDYTFSFWVNRKLDGNRHVISKGRDCLNSYSLGGGGQSFYANQGNTWCGGTGVGGLFPLNEWHHATGIIDNTNGFIRYYIDGSLASEKVIPAYTTTNTYPLILGRHFTNADGSGGFTYNFKGSIDDVRIYNRALTATEVLALAGGNLTNQAPAPTAPMLITTVGAAGTSQIAANDPNFLDTHTYAVSRMPANGRALVDRYGLATYTPNAAYIGADSFVVTVTDNTGLSSVVSINVTVKNTAGTLVFRDDFINANALQTNWAVVASSVPCCGAGNPRSNGVRSSIVSIDAVM